MNFKPLERVQPIIEYWHKSKTDYKGMSMLGSGELFIRLTLFDRSYWFECIRLCSDAKKMEAKRRMYYRTMEHVNRTKEAANED